MVRAKPRGPGYTISQFARATGQTERVIRTAVASGTIAAIDFNGMKRIPPRELQRWRELWAEPEFSTWEQMQS
jgi:hypothetical protein